MEISSSEYTKEEDLMMWEIHAARHGIMRKIEQVGVSKFNSVAMSFYENWKHTHEKKNLTSAVCHDIDGHL
jgi:hypothetical protein